MFLYLRIIFSILSALCVAALVPLGALVGWAWAGACLLGTFLFFGLTLLCKQSQELKEESTKNAQAEQENTQKDE